MSAEIIPLRVPGHRIVVTGRAGLYVVGVALRDGVDARFPPTSRPTPAAGLAIANQLPADTGLPISPLASLGAGGCVA